MAPLNASSWKLNAAEKKELEERVKGGEQEAAVKKELQTKKAQANADRKAAAQAVSEKCKLQQQPKAKAKAKSAAAMARLRVQTRLHWTMQPTRPTTFRFWKTTSWSSRKWEVKPFGRSCPCQLPTAQDMLLVVCKTRFAGRRLSRQFLVKASTDVPSPSAGPAPWQGGGLKTCQRTTSELQASRNIRLTGSSKWLSVHPTSTRSSPTTCKSSHLRRFCTRPSLRAHAPSSNFGVHNNLILFYFGKWVKRGQNFSEVTVTVQKFFPDHVPRLKGTLEPAEWEAKKKTWRAVLLSVPCSFCAIAAADAWKSAFNRRQAVLQEHESLSRTAIQSAMEIFHLKGLVETATGRTKLSAQSLSAELLKLGLQQVIGGSAKPGEDDDVEGGSLTPSFIGQALSVHKNVMSQPRVVELLMDLESRYGTRSCFHKMSKLASSWLTGLTTTSWQCRTSAGAFFKVTAHTAGWWRCSKPSSTRPGKLKNLRRT